MIEPSLLELLDIILATLNTIASADKNNVKPRPHHFELLQIIRGNNYKVDDTDFELVIEKLINDGYAKKVIGLKSSKDNPFDEKEYESYSITFNGRVFCLQNGYTQQKINADAESNRVEKLEISQQTLMGKLNVVTAWIAAGTVALVLIELWKMALEHH